MTAKIVAIKCPSCNGSGKFMSTNTIKCLWCAGVKKIRKKSALQYANHLVTLGIGGFICGDHDLSDQKKMLREADAICSAFGEKTFSPESAR